MTSTGAAGVQLSASAMLKSAEGSRFRASAIMAGEVSKPEIFAPGQRAASSSVELPGPQPISTT